MAGFGDPGGSSEIVLPKLLAGAGLDVAAATGTESRIMATDCGAGGVASAGGDSDSAMDVDGSTGSRDVVTFSFLTVSCLTCASVLSLLFKICLVIDDSLLTAALPVDDSGFLCSLFCVAGFTV